MFVSWAALFEGSTDDVYFSILLPRILEDLVARHCTVRPITIGDYPALKVGSLNRDREVVAEEICEGRGSFDLIFLHADTGGRALAEGLDNRCIAYAQEANTLCGFEVGRAVELCPKHETEAWALTDADAVCSALGFRGDPSKLLLPVTPRDAELLVDPKAVLTGAIRAVTNDRRGQASRLLALIAQIQRLDLLRQLSSFRSFEDGLLCTLEYAGYFR